MGISKGFSSHSHHLIMRYCQRICSRLVVQVKYHGMCTKYIVFGCLHRYIFKSCIEIG